MDFRLQSRLGEYLQQHGYAGDYDLMTLAGGIKGLAESPASAVGETIMANVAAASRLHQIREVVLVAHEDCLAYGGSRPDLPRDLELSRRLHDTQRAQALITARVPGLTCVTLLAVIEEGEFLIVRLPDVVRSEALDSVL